MMHGNDKRTSNSRLVIAAQTDVVAWTDERDCHCTQDIKCCHSDPDRLYADWQDLSGVHCLACNDADDLGALEGEAGTKEHAPKANEAALIPTSRTVSSISTAEVLKHIPPLTKGTWNVLAILFIEWILVKKTPWRTPISEPNDALIAHSNHEAD
jgi:hypothetical protein